MSSHSYPTSASPTSDREPTLSQSYEMREDLCVSPDSSSNARARNTGAAIARDHSVANTGVVIGDIHIGDRPNAHSAYHQRIRQFVPPELLGRSAELATLADFCTKPQAAAYLWWQAPAWSGKSALLSWFVFHPPRGTRVVSFFITARWFGQSDRRAFTDVVIEQLAEILSEPEPDQLTDATRDHAFLELLTRAAETCAARGERLILVVDGLDEDRGVTVTADSYSIAALLPVEPPAGMRIVVSGRPSPPLPFDVPSEHPLQDRTNIRTLVTSPHAMVLKDASSRELKHILQGNRLERDVLGLLVAAGGGLSADDLAELVRCSKWELNEHLKAVAGRTFIAGPGQWRSGVRVYALGHDELQREAVEAFGSSQLCGYRQRLHAWADEYRERSWPDETPEYLLLGYFQLLQNTADLQGMVTCGTDRVRHDRMLVLSGADSAAMAEITSAQDVLLAQDTPDLTAMSRLAVRRDALAQRSRYIPVKLPALWAALGDITKAEALALSIADPLHQVEALSKVLPAAAATGNTERLSALIETAESKARQTSNESMQSQALLVLAEAVAAVGDPQRAGTMAQVITPVTCQVQALVAALLSAIAAEDAAMTQTLTQQIEEVVSAADPQTRAYLLTDLVTRARGAAPSKARGWAEQAATAARTIDEPSTRALSLANLAVAAADLELDDQIPVWVGSAEATSHRVDNPDVRVSVHVAVATAAAHIGLASEAGSSFDSAETVAYTFTDPHQQALGLIIIADGAVKAGDIDRGRRVIGKAVLTAQAIEDSRWKSMVLRSVASVIASAYPDDIHRLEQLAITIPDPAYQAQAWTTAAMAAVTAGEIDRAEEIARRIPGSHELRWSLAELASRVAEAGYLERAAVLVDAIDDIPARSVALSDLAWMAHENGDDERARGLAEQAETAARASINPYHQGRPLVQLATNLARIGDIQRACDVARLITVPALYFEALTSTVTQASYTAIDAAEALAIGLPGLYRVRALADVIAAALNAGNLGRAHRLIEHARATVSMLTPAEQASAFVTMTPLVARVGDLDLARLLANQAHATIKTLPRGREQATALIDLALGVASIGDPQLVCRLAEEAEQAGQAIIDVLDRASLPADLATRVSLSVVNSPELTQWASDQAAAAAADPTYRDGALSAVVSVAASSGDLDRAEAAANAITSPSVQATALGATATAAARARDFGRADSIARRITDSSWQGRMIADVVRAMAEAGDLAAAEELARVVSDPYEQSRTSSQLASAVEPRRAGRLIAFALRNGHWTMPLLVLSKLQPTALQALADEVIRP